MWVEDTEGRCAEASISIQETEEAILCSEIYNFQSLSDRPVMGKLF